jgi:hypothetical protein
MLKYNKKIIFILKAAFNAIEATLLFLRRQEIQPPLGFVVSGVSKVSESTRKLFVNLLLIVCF